MFTRLNPRYVLSSVPTGTEMTRPSMSVRRSGSVVVVSGFWFATSSASMYVNGRGLMFTSGMNRWVPLLPMYATSTTVLDNSLRDTVRFQFWM